MHDSPSVTERVTRAEIGVHTELHGGDEITYGSHPDVLLWLEINLRDGQRTLETGCGLSTAVFAARGTEHICISPFADEHTRISSWCVDEGIDTSRVRFIADRSDLALPALDARDLDLALIDGSHSFPQVFIDYWYTAERLAIGGVLIVDDLQLWTGQTLNDFLEAEPGWALEREWFGKTSAFRKTAETDPLRSWSRQPYVLSRSSYAGLRGYLMLIRNRKFRWAMERGRTAVRTRVRSRF